MSIDELYCLPKASEDYYDLQEALSQAQGNGLSYDAPASGARREPVQLVDLDHDGTDEAVAFFRSSQDGSVAAYIFARRGSQYELADQIPCSGSAVGAVEYADLDGSGSLELLITCQVSEAVTQALQVSRYQNNAAESLLTAPCGRYVLTDLNGDGAKEILCITDSGAEASAAVTYYTYVGGQMKTGQELRLSENYSDILNIAQGTLEDGTEAVLITGTAEDQMKTDVLIQNDQAELTADGLRNAGQLPHPAPGRAICIPGIWTATAIWRSPREKCCRNMRRAVAPSGPWNGTALPPRENPA